jgi:hypothetical protein
MPLDTACLDSLLARLDARAAGVWRVEGDRLVRLAFVAAGDMPRNVAEGFAAATSEVGLDRLDLGIVAAAVERRRKVSLAAGLPTDSGSGYWLRAFGASRSVALPVGSWVVSVALAGDGPTDDEVEAILLASILGSSAET